MIGNLTRTEFQRVFSALEATDEAVFHLTGSRYHLTSDLNDQSDWDFFTEKTPGTIQWLIDLGFEFEGRSDHGYGDRQCWGVMKHSGANIHVQLILKSYLSDRIRINNALRGNLSFRAMPKKQRAEIWRNIADGHMNII